MCRVLKTGLFLWIVAATCLGGELSIRLDGDRIWLTADRVPLSGLLQTLARFGVDVQLGPGVKKSISGRWEGMDVEDVFGNILYPFDYSLEWQRRDTPHGPSIHLTGIRVFQEGHSSAVQRVLPERRVEQSVDGQRRFVAREILVGFAPGSSIDDLQAFLSRTGGTVLEAKPVLGVYRILLPPGANVLDAAEQLINDPAVALAEPNYVVELPESIPSEGSPVEQPVSWPDSKEAPIAVAVLDSGLTPDASLNRAVIDAFDATAPDTVLTTDPVGHGTLMAKLAAGLLDPYGTTVGEGVPVVAIKAFDDNGSADSFTLMNAITRALENSAGPISLSWGSETPSKFIENAVQYARSQGRLVFAAVGNENTGRPMYPAAYDGIIGVAATGVDGQLAEYSNRGDFADIAVAGSAGGSQGTSVATAALAHIAAKYQRKHPAASADEIEMELRNAAGSDKILSQDEVTRLLAR